MKRFKTLALRSLFCILLLNCGKSDQEDLTVVTFQMRGAQFATAQNGGVVVYGIERKLQLKAQGALQTNSGPQIITIPQGNWHFFALGWEGAGNKLTGTLRCGDVVENLFGKNSVNLVIEISAANCADEKFISPAFLNGNQPHPLKIVGCNDNTTAAIVDGDTTCLNANHGGFIAFKVKIPGTNKAFGPGDTPPILSSIDGPCTQVGAIGTNHSLATPAIIPVAAGKNNPLGIIIDVFENNTCSLPFAKRFTFPIGLQHPSLGEVAQVEAGTGVTTVFLEDPQHAQVVEQFTNGQDGVNGIGNPLGIILTPNGKFLYVAGNGDASIAIFSRDEATGRLTFVGIKNGVAGTGNIFGFAMHPDGTYLFSVGGADDSVAAFSINQDTGELTHLSSVTDGASCTVGCLDDPTTITMAPSGDHLYVSCFSSDTLTTLFFDKTNETLNFIESDTKGVPAGFTMDGPSDVQISPDGKHVYILGANTNDISVFSRNTTTGAVTFVEIINDGGVDQAGNAVGKLALPAEVHVSDDGNYVYVTAETDKSITVFTRDSDTGILTFLQEKTDGVGVNSGLQNAKGFRISPSGNFAYATAKDSDEAFTTYQRNPDNGKILFAEHQNNGLAVNNFVKPQEIAVSPDGRFAYVGAETSDTVTVWKLDI